MGKRVLEQQVNWESAAMGLRMLLESVYMAE